MSDIPAETTNRLAAFLIDRYGIEEAMPLVRFAFARTEAGDITYGKPLLPWDGRDSLMDALEEAVDLSQYLMKKVIETKAMAAKFQEAGTYLSLLTATRPQQLARECLDMAAMLRADCERRVPVARDKTRCIGCGKTEDELHTDDCPHINGWVLGPAERLAQMEGESWTYCGDCAENTPSVDINGTEQCQYCHEGNDPEGES